MDGTFYFVPDRARGWTWPRCRVCRESVMLSKREGHLMSLECERCDMSEEVSAERELEIFRENGVFRLS